MDFLYIVTLVDLYQSSCAALKECLMRNSSVGSHKSLNEGKLAEHASLPKTIGSILKKYMFYFFEREHELGGWAEEEGNTDSPPSRELEVGSIS